MGPSRAKQDSSASSVPRPFKERPHKNLQSHPYSKRPQRLNDEDALPGVQKLKSALRQTKRLLAKGDLAADVRVETERRLKALEADLARAELSRRERLYATKYHKAKFFERQKIVRKINRTKRDISSAEGKEEEKLESILVDLRVDLNYVLHFPKTRKYISLFPPEVRNSGSAVTPIVPSSDDNKERTGLREIIRQQMERGELSAEPENEPDKLRREDKRPKSTRRGADAVPQIKPQTHRDSVANDDFFGDDEEEDSQGGASDS